MQLTWIPARRRYVGTQTEARQAREVFETREVPTVKADLIAFLNEQEEDAERRIAEAATSGEGDADERAAPDDHAEDAPTPPPAAPTGRPTDAAPSIDRTTQTPTQAMAAAVALADAIAELQPRELAPVLSAAIGRLGEVAQHHGWAVFGKNVYSWSPGAKTVEQGLGMLMLAAIDQLRPDRPDGRRPIGADEGEKD